MNKGKTALNLILEGLDELGCFDGAWSFHHNPDNCGNYTVEPKMVLGTICCLPKDYHKSFEKLQHITRCDPPTIRSIATYVAELEMEVIRLKCENYRNRAVAQIHFGDANENLNLDGHLIDDQVKDSS